MKENLKNKKIGIVVPQKNFWRDELEPVLEKLDELGCEVYIIAREFETCSSLERYTVTPDLTTTDFNANDFDGLILMGGPGAINYCWNDAELIEKLQIVKNSNPKILALSTAPVVLAKAGLLEGKKATVFQDFNANLIFDDHKVIYEKDRIIVSDNIITTNLKDAALEALEKFLEKVGE
ncbi:MAG: DJ-1/PfpI/YhbO family deglycase/protease [Calditrichia bacterium]